MFNDRKMLQVLIIASVVSGICCFPQLTLGPLSDAVRKLTPFSVNPYVDAGLGWTANHFPLQGFTGFQFGYPWVPKPDQQQNRSVMTS